MNTEISDTAAAIFSIELDLIDESPSNPRRTFGESGLAELAADIAAVGVHSPVLVRPIGERFELVFGHRRKRAATIAQLTAIPCMVRALTDLETRRLQISENLEREDLHPYEEAEGFASLIRDHGFNADQIIEQTGKSKSYVYGRLKLAYLTEFPRDAFLRGEISTEIALYIARLPSAKMQQQAMTVVKEQGYNIGRGERTIRNELIDRFTLGLDKAIFDTASAELLPAAGACTTCPKRSGNAPEFEDLTTKPDGHARHYITRPGPEQCTDPDCFAAKKTQHLQNSAAALTAERKVVIVGAKARQAIGADGKVKGDFIALKDARDLVAKARAAAQRDSKIVPPQIVVLQDQRTGKTVEAVKRSELVAAGVVKPEAKAPKGEKRERDYEQERRDREALGKRTTERNTRLLQAIRQQQQVEALGLYELRTVVRSALLDMEMGDDGDTLSMLHDGAAIAKLIDNVDAMNPNELSRLLLDAAMCRDVASNGWSNSDGPPELLVEMAATYGIDAESAMAEPKEEPAPTPLPAARAPKKAKAAPTKNKTAAKKAAPIVRYRNPATGDSWSGRGLRPAWLKAALASGQSLGSFVAQDDPTNQTDDAGVAGKPADIERDPNTSDMFEEVAG